MPGDFDYLLWAYRAVFTQTNAGGGTAVVNIIANERMVILYGVLGPDDYAADRILSGTIRDSGDKVVGVIFLPTAIDNESVPFPMDQSGAIVTLQGNQFFNKVVIGKGENLQLKASGLVQNETFTVAVRALIRSWPPTVSTTGSGGTVTTTTTYDKVI